MSNSKWGEINRKESLTQLDLAVIFYGVDTEGDHDAKEDAEQAAAELADLRAENERLKGAIIWALGYTDFSVGSENTPKYWWRPKLRELSGMTEEQIRKALRGDA